MEGGPEQRSRRTRRTRSTSHTTEHAGNPGGAGAGAGAGAGVYHIQLAARLPSVLGTWDRQNGFPESLHTSQAAAYDFKAEQG